jgi:hypothetical protein
LLGSRWQRSPLRLNRYRRYGWRRPRFAIALPSGLAGVHTKVLFGNPSAAGFYSILLFVPAHTAIQAHSHRDDRMATVVSGIWHLGYGDHFDAQSLKTLPPGSVCSERLFGTGGVNHNHFARTDNEAVVVHISGYGPTDTRYFDPANEPKAPQKK